MRLTLFRNSSERNARKGPDDTAQSKTPRATKSGTTKGAIDGCLVGAWRSQSVAVTDRDRGGSGILLTITTGCTHTHTQGVIA